MRLNPAILAWMAALATLVAAAAAAYPIALPGCKDTCGNVSVPYPFGMGVSSVLTSRNCFLDEAFNLTCVNSTLFTGNVEVLNISLQGQLDMSFFVGRACYNESGEALSDSPDLKTATLTINSTENKFITVGCDSFGYLNSYQSNKLYTTGCLTRCQNGIDEENSETCSGIGCCQVDIPVGMKNISIEASGFDNQIKVLNFNNCSYAFIAKQGSYEFNPSHVYKGLPNKSFPLVVDWAVGNEMSCKDAKRKQGYACQKNSHCNTTHHIDGYRCICNDGYEGNPYHPDGCQNINECKDDKHDCEIVEYCQDSDGYFECRCPPGYHGDGKKKGSGCRRDDYGTKEGSEQQLSKIVIGASAGFLALFVSISWLYLMYQKRKLIKLKEKFFRQNGGFILQQRLSTREDSSQVAQIFTAEQLKKATNNYDESLIIGKGGYGTVFKAFLSNNRIVAIKKSKVVDQTQIEQFINEVVVLSQINHRNVVKLLGCCLDTEVPLLVYEFVNNGTLFDYIHNESKANNVSWPTRLRIAAEAAGALSYLHSAASIPIIHRDVKTANILLDETYTAKVSDFGASRLIPLDQAELATMVQGTIGYLDPEYMQTSQLTEKSDVYSFGVVLVELVTGEKVLSFDRPEGKRSLAMYFLSCLKEDRLFEVTEIGLVNEENKKEVMEVAVLATKCLRLRGDERPCMKEVAMELEGIRVMEKHPWGNQALNLEETECLLQETSCIYEEGDTSNHPNTTYDSVIDHVLIAFDDGR